MAPPLTTQLVKFSTASFSIPVRRNYYHDAMNHNPSHHCMLLFSNLFPIGLVPQSPIIRHAIAAVWEGRLVECNIIPHNDQSSQPLLPTG